MLENMILPLQRYADFSGRSRRLEFWSFAFLNLVVTGVLVSLAFSTGLSYRALVQQGDFGGGLGVATIAFFAILAIYGLAVLIPGIAVNVRRLHDRDMSGWWYLGFVLVGLLPFVGWLTNIAYLVLVCLPGTPGPNRYGHDPKDIGGAALFA